MSNSVPNGTTSDGSKASSELEGVLGEIQKLKVKVDENSEAIAQVQKTVDDVKRLEEANTRRLGHLAMLGARRMRHPEVLNATDFLKVEKKHATFLLAFKPSDFRGNGQNEVSSNIVELEGVAWQVVITNIDGKNFVLRSNGPVQEGSEPQTLTKNIIFGIPGEQRTCHVTLIQETFSTRCGATICIPSQQYKTDWPHEFIKTFAIDGLLQIDAFFEDASRQPRVKQEVRGVQAYSFQRSHMDFLVSPGDEVIGPRFAKDNPVAQGRPVLTRQPNGGLQLSILWDEQSNSNWKIAVETAEIIRKRDWNVAGNTEACKSPDGGSLRDINLPAAELQGLMVEINL